MTVTKKHAVEVLRLLSFGLVKGVGVQKPGKMCVEAAVCCALGLPHSDNPPCVSQAVRAFKITLNDANWSSTAARAKGLCELAVAQLGSNEIDESIFVRELTLSTIRIIVPIALRAAAKIHTIPARRRALEKAAGQCEVAPCIKAASAAAAAAYDAIAYDAVAYAAVAYAAVAYDAVAYAAVAHAIYTTASAIAADAAYVAYTTASAVAAVAYAAYAAAANAANAADAADANATRDLVLAKAAQCGVAALKVAKSPGCRWLPLCKYFYATKHKYKGRCA